MAHPLEKKIAGLRRQARRLLALYGLGWVVASVVAAVLLLGLADYLIHFQDLGIRVICSLAVLLVGVWTGYRYLYSSLAMRLRDVDVARRVERRFPTLDDRLSSTVEFLKTPADDPAAGSLALRRAVICEATDEVERLDLSEVLERRPARRALAGAAAICLLGALLVACDPVASRVAIARLARPFGNDAWPKLNDLAFRSPPERIAGGQTFEVELVDLKGRLPAEVRIHYRYDNDRQSIEDVDTMKLLGGVMVARKENTTRPFSYRAEGGDDQSMPWKRLEVVEPPRVESLKVTLYPPAYTGWSVETSDKHIHALRGTRVELSGAATKPLAAAVLRQEGGPEIPAKLAADGFGFSLPGDPQRQFVIDKSGAYWLEMKDDSGFAGGADNRWEIRAVADQPPTVSIDQPAADIFVTPDAVVPLKIVAKDDLAIHEVALEFGRSGAAETAETLLKLWTGPERVEPAQTTGPLSARQLGESRTVEHRWALASLGLKPGTYVTFRASAVDYLPQVGKSPARRLTIITPQQLEDRLAQRQAVILGELGRVLKMQQDARAQTTALEIQMREVGRLNKQDVDHAQGAELNQRQLTHTLTSPTEGIPAQIADLLADLENNKVDSPDIQRRMHSMLDEITRLGQQHFSVIQRELTSVIKGAQAKLPPDTGGPPADEKPAADTSAADPRLSQSLLAVGEHQDRVIESLETMLGSLAEWDNYRRFAREVGQVRRDQQEIERETKRVAQQTLGKDLKDLDAQQQADLKKLARREMEMARRFDKIQQQMDQTKDRLEKSDPLAAATIADALDQARRQAISGQMRQSGDHAEKNQVGQAIERQEKIGRDLEEMLDILSNRREHELSRLIKKLREAEQQMSAVRKQEEALRKKLSAAAAGADELERRRELERLARQQKQLQEEAQRLARRLERLQAERAGRSTAAAAAKMGGSGAAGERGNAAEAEHQAQRAQADLVQAQQQLAERRRQAEADLAQEQLARVENSLLALREREKNVHGETERLEQARAEKGQLSRAQTAGLLELSREQKTLQVETRALAEKLAAAEVFNLALEGVGQQMSRAVELLEQRDTGSAAQRAEQNALNRLAQMLTALKSDAAEKSGQQAGAGGQGQQGPQDAIRSLAELKLLKLLQEDLNERFQARAEPPADESAEQRAGQLAELSQEQGRLAGLALRLAEPPDKNPADDPEDLPDLPEPEQP